MTDGDLTVQAVNRDDADCQPANTESLWGGIDPPPSWVEYLDDFKDDFKPYIVAARLWLIETFGDEPPTADQWCNEHMLCFSDGFCLSFTWRANSRNANLDRLIPLLVIFLRAHQAASFRFPSKKLPSIFP